MRPRPAGKDAGRKSNPKRESEANILHDLDDAEAASVLRKLLDRHSELRAEAETIARETVTAISPSSVAKDVENAVLQFDYDDLNDRAGRHSWGYVEPGEAALELLEEALEPFVDDMKHYLEMDFEDKAWQLCQGILLGLYRVRDGKNDVLGWAPDFPAEAAGGALEVWSETGRARLGGAPAKKERRRISPEFVREHLPDWDWLLKPQS
jgi:hypothetical protein